MLHALKRFIPPGFLDAYHRLLAWAAAAWYRHPSQSLLVVGVTGTNGKSTTVRLIADLLAGDGHLVGCTSTAELQVGKRRWLNDTKMTMPGRFALQRLLRQMVDAGCWAAVVETSSQGIVQHRHRGITYDIVVCTNLTPEHIEAHGGFVAYRAAKGQLFSHLTVQPRKTLGGKTIPRVSVVNLDDGQASYFLQFAADRKIGFTRQARYDLTGVDELRAEALAVGPLGSRWRLRGVEFTLPLLGAHNVENALAAVAVGHAAGLALPAMAAQLARARTVPGRLEFITAGQPFRVIVDYAPEPVGVGKLYETLALLGGGGRTIHVLGSTGGGRDAARRPVLGRLAGQHADVVVVTNEDPYDDDPQVIIDEVAAGAREVGKRDGVDLFTILDRRTAIAHALREALPGDTVVVTGKGCEQAMAVSGGHLLPWDDRRVIREELDKIRDH